MDIGVLGLLYDLPLPLVSCLTWLYTVGFRLDILNMITESAKHERWIIPG